MSEKSFKLFVEICENIFRGIQNPPLPLIANDENKSSQHRRQSNKIHQIKFLLQHLDQIQENIKRSPPPHKAQPHQEQLNMGLMNAVHKNQADKVQYLMDLKADPYQMVPGYACYYHNVASPFLLAVEDNSLFHVKMLLKK